MTNKHSALPWKTSSREDTNWWFILEDKDGHEIGSGDGGLEECDARLIVNAVNNYDRLLDALEGAADCLEEADYTGASNRIRLLLSEIKVTG